MRPLQALLLNTAPVSDFSSADKDPRGRKYLKYTQFCQTISSDSMIGPGLPSSNFFFIWQRLQMRHRWRTKPIDAMMKPVVAVVPHPINDAGHQEKEGRGVTK